MRLHRIYAIILRFMYLFKHSFDRQSDIFYWPAMDLLLWGLTSTYFGAKTGDSSLFVSIVVSGLLLWVIVWRGQYEVTVNLLEDLWNKNLINIFVSPLSFWEWITAFLTLGIVKSVLSMGVASLLGFLLYQVNILNIGWALLPFFFLLLMTGWWVGFLVAGIILRFGTKIQHLAWSMVFLIAPFSGVYYPISVLPNWAQSVAHFIPTSYIFEGARSAMANGTVDAMIFLKSLALNLVYLCLTLIFLRISFNVRLAKGLQKLQD